MFLLHRLPTARIVVPSTVGPSVRRGLRRTILDCWLRSPPSSFQKDIIVMHGTCVHLVGICDLIKGSHLRDQWPMPWPLSSTLTHYIAPTADHRQPWGTAWMPLRRAGWRRRKSSLDLRGGIAQSLWDMESGACWFSYRDLGGVSMPASAGFLFLLVDL
jgi:hypothetical protein